MKRIDTRKRIKKALQNKRRKETLESTRFWGNVDMDSFTMSLAKLHPMSIPSYSDWVDTVLKVTPLTDQEKQEFIRSEVNNIEVEVIGDNTIQTIEAVGYRDSFED